MMEEKSKLDLLLSSFQRCIDSDSPSSSITHLLVMSQAQITPNLFDNYSSQSIAKSFTEIWRFFLFCASNPSSSVRLLCYRATGSFLLKMMRHFPVLVQKTFSDITMESTIDVKSSGIIAGSFAFISKNVGTPFLEQFLDMTPVFHHLTISDSMFSEHLPSIISNLGDLGVDWYRTLLHSFLEVYFNLNSSNNDCLKTYNNTISSNNNILKSISEIIKHNKVILMNEVLQFINEKNDYKLFLSLISFILASVKFDLNSFDLSFLAKSALDVLNDIDNSSLIDIDCALQILSTNSNTFSLNIIHDKDEDFRFILKTKDEENQIVFNAHKCLSRPSFYLLKCPIEFCLPNESDGVLTLTSKFKELANIIKTDTSKIEYLFDVFSKYISSKYNEQVSAAIQGISICLPELIEKIDHNKMLKLLKSIIFTEIEGWFHAVDVLLVIEKLNVGQIYDFFGNNGLIDFIDILLKLLLIKNNRVKSLIIKILQNYISPLTYELITNRIAESINFYDDESLIPTLEILTNLLNSLPNYPKTHLNYLLYVFIDYFPFSKNNLLLMHKIFDFFCCFDLSSFTIENINYPFLSAQLVLVASLQIVSGFSLSEKFVPEKKLQKMISFIDKDIQSKDIDVISEKELDYKDYLAPAYSALKFINKLSSIFIDNDFAETLLSQLVVIFPLESLMLLENYWNKLSQKNKSSILYNAIKNLTFIQDCQYVMILCKLFFDYFEEFGTTEESKNKVLNFVVFLLKNKRYKTPEQLSVFSAFQSFFLDKSKENISQLKIQQNKEITYDKLSFCDKKFKFINYTLDNLTEEQNIDSPIIITQLKLNKYSFNVDKIQQIFDYCIKIDDKNLLELLLNYVSKQKIKINIDNKINLPTNLKPLIIQFMKSNKYKELDEIGNYYKQNYDGIPQELFTALVSSFPDDYIEFLQNQEKVTKIQLSSLLKSISRISFYQNKFPLLIINLIRSLKSEKKIEYCLMILSILTYRMKSISENLAIQITDVIEKNCKNHLYISSLLLFLLIQKYQSFRLYMLTSKCIQLATPISPELYFLNYILVNYDKKNSYDPKITPKLQVPFLQLKLPSSYLCAIKIIKLFSSSFPDSKELFAKYNLTLIMNNISAYLNIYPIPENLMSLINLFLSSSMPKKIYSKILSDLDKWLPKQNEASFHPFCNYIVNIYKICSKIKSNQITTILQVMETLKTTPGNSFLMSKYLKLLDVVTSEEIEKETYAMNSVTTWLENGIINSDCYFSYNIIYDWCVYLYKNVYFTEFLPILTIHFIKYGNRFFPIFAGITKFIQTFLTQNTDKDKKEQLLLSIQAAADMFEITCRAHGKAISLIPNKNMTKASLQLSLFDKDCEKSETILSSINK